MADGQRGALVTGAGSGIGRACAVALARQEFSVVVSDVSEEGGAETVRTITDAGGTASFLRADVTEPGECETLAETVVERYGRLAAAVNNAGIGGEQAMLADYSVEGWRQVLAVNLDGVFYCCRAQLPRMLAAGGGTIVNMASILGSVGFATAPAYVAAKHGVVGLTKNAALEYGPQGIRVNAVGPGFIRTPLLENMDDEALSMLVGLHPVGRLGEAEEVAALVAWLCSDAASFVNGAYYPVDGGYLAR